MYKAIVIGAGPSGYSAAIRVSQLGGKTMLIERDLVGGICVNWGCTPSKAMITSAKVIKQIKNSKHYGINVDNISVDFGQIASRRDEVMASSREEIKHLLDHWQVELIQGSANILSKNSVEVNGTVYEAENIIIATGSKPLIPGFIDETDPSIINSNKLITIDQLPTESR